VVPWPLRRGYRGYVEAVLMPNPLDPDPVPAPVRLRFGNELYLFTSVTALW
jgi:hypothetical protein